jgi:hypothetical protein
VFIGDAGVLDRHFPAAKVNELRAEFFMGAVKSGALEHELLKNKIAE